MFTSITEDKMKPSIIGGIASIIDLFGVYTPYDTIVYSEDTEQKDLEADIAALQYDASIAFAGIKTQCQKRTAR